MGGGLVAVQRTNLCEGSTAQRTNVRFLSSVNELHQDEEVIEMLKMMNTQKMWQWEERGRMAWVAGLLMQTKNKTEQSYNELQADIFPLLSYFL